MENTGLTYELLCRYPNARVWDVLDEKVREVYSIGKSNGMIEFQTSANGDSDWGNYGFFKLILKPLSGITYEDATSVADLCFFVPDAMDSRKELASISFIGNTATLTHVAADYLRTRNYCTEEPDYWWIDEKTISGK